MPKFWVPTALLVEAATAQEAQDRAYALLSELVQDDLDYAHTYDEARTYVLDYFTYDLNDPENGVDEHKEVDVAHH